jgi:hypothetical protein
MQLVSTGNGQTTRPFPKLCLGLIVLASAAALFVGCAKHREDGSTPGVAIKHEISPDPPHVGAATLTLKLTDATAVPITKAHVVLEADMLHPGMVPRPFEVKEVEPGSYRAQVQFDMAGDWVILLHIILPDGDSLDRQFEIKGVHPN